MIHYAFDFIEDLIVHVDSLLHGSAPRFKCQGVVNEIDNCAFVRLTHPEFQPAQDGRTALSC
jgi:hypothetical protein